MIKIIGVSDFPFMNSGIFTCLSRITRNYHPDSYLLYSDQNIEGFIKVDVQNMPINNDKIILFTHIEYSGLSKLIRKFNNPLVYVCDWPPIYWDSVKKNDNYIKGLLGKIRFYFRIRNLQKDIKYIFVAKKDCYEAFKYGYINSKYIPLGVDFPLLKIKSKINTDILCFTGNFRYEPNLSAAIELIKFAKINPQFNFVFAGYFAQDLEAYDITDNIKIFQNVPSIIDFLINLRPIYVSNIKYGAGAKNKILEAIVSGCPIIASVESLDESLLNNRSIINLENIQELTEKIGQIKKGIDSFEKTTRECSKNMINERSWKKISIDLLSLLND